MGQTNTKKIDSFIKVCSWGGRLGARVLRRRRRRAQKNGTPPPLPLRLALAFFMHMYVHTNGGKKLKNTTGRMYSTYINLLISMYAATKKIFL